MRKLILFILMLSSLFASAQTVTTISTADSTKFKRTTGTTNAEVIIENGTRNVTGGFLWNRWNGRTQFRLITPEDISGLQDSLTKKANRTFDNVASGAIAKSKADTSATGLQTVSNFFPKGDTRWLKIGAAPTISTTTISNGGATNGLSYNAGVIRLHKVTSSTGGVLTTGTDTIAGVKNFTASPIIQSSGDSYLSAVAGMEASESGFMLKDRTQNKWRIYKAGTSQDLEIWNYGTSTKSLTIGASSNTITFPSLPSGIVKSTSGALGSATVGSDYTLLNGTGIVSMAGTTASYLSSTGTGNVAKAVSPSFTGTTNFVNVEVTGAHTINNANAAADALRYNNTIAATNVYNSNAGAGTAYQFKFNAAGSLAVGGGIAVLKENTTDGDFAAEVGLYNRANGGNVTKVFKVSSAGVPQIPLMTGASTEMVTISTDGTLGRTAIPTGGGGGSVATIGIASANGLAGTSDGNATNPTLTLSTSVSGMVKANGTAFSAAVGDTDFQVPLTFSTGLTRTVNTITVNQAFTPTWTGVHTFSNNIVANGQINMSSQSAARIIGGSTDFAINNAANNASNIAVLDNGNTTIRGSIAPLGGITFASLAAGRIIGGSTDFAINNSANTLNNIVVLDNGNTTVRGTIGASNFSGTSSGTNTGDQTWTTLSGKPTFATVATSGAYSDLSGTPSLSGYAPLASPALTGNPTAPTQTQGDNSTKIATTAYVDGAITAGTNRILKDWYTDANNVTTTETDLYDYTVPANTLANNGDKLSFNISGSYGATANNKSLKIYFGALSIGLSNSTSNTGKWNITGTIIRTGSTTFRININEQLADFSLAVGSTSGTVTNYTGTNIFKISGTGVASADITAQMGYLEFKPAAL